MLLDVLTYPNARLRRVSRPVEDITADIREICGNLAETMLVKDGVGLAAPQVGIDLRIFVLNDNGPKFFINPIITRVGDTLDEMMEGCLSFPGIFIKVKRNIDLQVFALGLDGRPFTTDYSGLFSRAVQHEMDHLNGVLLADYMSNLKRQMVEKKLSKIGVRG